MAKQNSQKSQKPSQKGSQQKPKTLSKKEKDNLIAERTKELNELSIEDFNARFKSQIGRPVEELDDRNLLTEELASFEVKADLEAQKEKGTSAKSGDKGKLASGQIEVTDSEGKTYQVGKPGENDYIVKQWNERDMNGGMVVVPNTIVVQTYNKAIFDKMVESDFWNNSQMNYEVLQEPASGTDTDTDEDDE